MSTTPSRLTARCVLTDRSPTKIFCLRRLSPAVRVATQYAPPLSPRHAPPKRRNVAVLSNAEYVPTLTAAAALRVKTVLSKAAW